MRLHGQLVAAVLIINCPATVLLSNQYRTCIVDPL